MVVLLLKLLSTLCMIHCLCSIWLHRVQQEVAFPCVKCCYRQMHSIIFFKLLACNVHIPSVQPYCQGIRPHFFAIPHSGINSTRHICTVKWNYFQLVLYISKIGVFSMLYSRYDTYCVCGCTLPVGLSGGVAGYLTSNRTKLNWYRYWY